MKRQPVEIILLIFCSFILSAGMSKNNQSVPFSSYQFPDTGIFRACLERSK